MSEFSGEFSRPDTGFMYGFMPIERHYDVIVPTEKVRDIMSGKVYDEYDKSIYLHDHGHFMPHPDKPMPSEEERGFKIHGYGRESGCEITLYPHPVSIGRAILNKLIAQRPRQTYVDIAITSEIVRLAPYHPLANVGAVRSERDLYAGRRH